MEPQVEFHGTGSVPISLSRAVLWNSPRTALVSEICALQIPWNFVELLVSAKLAHSKFHGIPWNCSCIIRYAVNRHGILHRHFAIFNISIIAEILFAGISHQPKFCTLNAHRHLNTSAGNNRASKGNIRRFKYQCIARLQTKLPHNEVILSNYLVIHYPGNWWLNIFGARTPTDALI